MHNSSADRFRDTDFNNQRPVEARTNCKHFLFTKLAFSTHDLM